MMFYLFGFLEAIAWLPMFNGATALRWALLAVAIPAILFTLPENPRSNRNPGMFMLLLLVTIHLLCFTSRESLLGFDDFIHIGILFMVFYLATRAPDLRGIWVGLAVGINISGYIALAQMFGFDGITQYAPPSGLFNNRNVMAEAGAIALLVTIHYRLWWLLPGALLAAFLPVSKAVIGALALVAVFWPSAGGYRVTGIRAYMAIAVAGIFAVALGGASLTQRYDIWAPAIQAFNLTGHGLGSFFEDFPMPAYAHNEFIQMWYEWGLYAVPFFVAFIAAVLKEWRFEQSIVACVLMLCVFSFPLHMPLTAFCFALALGRMFGAGDNVCSAQYAGGMGHLPYISRP